MRRLSDYLKETYGEKVYEISLSSGCTCPNRDGTQGYGGCTFCSELGSGDFAAQSADKEALSADGVSDEAACLDAQIEDAKARIRKKTDAKKFIAYYQSFTNTYGDIERLTKLYTETIKRDDIEILSIATRPDCIGWDVMDMLKGLKKIKPVWVELGLQTIRDDIAESFHRGFLLSDFEGAYRRLAEFDIPVVVHVIFGLPGESKDDMLNTIRYLAGLVPPLFGIKIQMLHIIKGTQMAEQYEKEPFPMLTLEEYADLVCESAKILPEETVLHRMTGDAPGKLLIAPEWTRNKKKVLNTINKKLGE